MKRFYIYFRKGHSTLSSENLTGPYCFGRQLKVFTVPWSPAPGESELLPWGLAAGPVVLVGLSPPAVGLDTPAVPEPRVSPRRVTGRWQDGAVSPLGVG